MFIKLIHNSIVIITFGLFLSGCSMTGKHYKNIPEKPFPIKIGALADSQITSRKGSFNYGMRRKAADTISNVAIRPAAIEYLAPEMLRYFLAELEKERVDVIIYLGDGANSGCKDELDTVFLELEQSRKRSGIPSYYLIGNHDYLGTGNQVRFDIRENLCDRGFEGNPPESKKEVIARINTHNVESSRIDESLSYTSEMVAVSSGDGNVRCNDKSQFNNYYVGKLTSKDIGKAKLEILLVDTSDYRDVMFKATIDNKSGCEILGGWGMKGSLSYKKNDLAPSQIEKLLSMSDLSADYRLVASHYQPDDFNAIYPFNFSPSRVKDELGNLLSDGANYWLSGHTHTTSPKVKKYKVGKTFGNGKKGAFLGINIGSTTDYPHAVVIEKPNDKTEDIDSWLAYRVLMFPNNVSVCSEILELAESTKSEFNRVCENTSIVTMLGLDKKYKERCWNGLEVERVQNNIELLIDKSNKKLSLNRLDVVSCLAINAAANEH